MSDAAVALSAPRPLSRGLSRTLRLLAAALAYEQRRVTAFRVGFIVKEVLRGTAKPLAMAFVYLAMFRSSGVDTIRGYAYWDFVQYLVLAALLQKVGIEDRQFDVAEQIFDGYVTKYLVMPVRVQSLVVARWVHAVLLQCGIGLVAWLVGLALLPGRWPVPVSGLATLEALTLVVLGSYCYFMAIFILNALAFWLDVVWNLVVMFRFVTMFVGGLLIPVSVMPDALHRAFAWLFPYWTLFAPIEILLGRQGTPEFVRGIVVLAVSAVGLRVVAEVTWRRGLSRYCGVGM